MKTEKTFPMKKQFKLLILAILLPFLGFSNEGNFAFVKQKSIKKAFIVNLDAALNIDNSYGNITVTTWDEDKIEFDISIKVSGDNEKWVNQKINDIDVNINALKGLVTANTIIGNSTYKSNRNSNFEINYSVKIPKNGSIKLYNKYGNITTSDLNGGSDINCKYGKLTVGKLYNTHNIIQIEYCPDSSIDVLKNGQVTARYSELKINETKKLDLVSDYTDVTIQDSDMINYSSKYGTIKIQNVNTLNATGNYLTLKIGEIFDKLNLNTKYSNITIGVINAKANSVAIVAGYSGISVGYQPNFAFNFDVTVRYANFKFDNDLELSTKEEKNNTKIYTGFYKKKGINTVSIISDYGNVTLTKK
jgi:hypothetical protein